ncbi:MAG: hypothetical protein MUC50_06085 [Myxococcota bacterium]|nr:hypothetical protein [Myxococcota bacterium]
MSCLLSFAADFVPVTASQGMGVSGLYHLIGAYAVIIGGLLAYGFYLALRHRALARNAGALAQRCARRNAS